MGSATFSLAENSATGTAVGTATFTDDDTGQGHTFSITDGNTNGAFAIDPLTGAITVADQADVDYETTPSFALTVTVADDGSPLKSDSETVTIDLSNVNEAPTDITLSATSVAENTDVGTAVGSFTVTDQDSGDTNTLALVAGTGDTDNARFTIDNGVLETAESFDFETQSPFSIRVRTTDSANLQREEAFSITVLNVNEKPAITAPASIPATLDVANNMAGISISDPDSGTQAIELRLAVLNGTLDVDTSVVDGVVSADVAGNGTDTVVITASQQEINATLAAVGGLTYENDDGFAGTSDTLALATDDLGKTGSGGAQTDSKNVTISFNEAPVAAGQTPTTAEDTEKTITLAATDAENDTLTYKITALPGAGGTLHEGATSGGTLITAGALPFTLAGDQVTYVPGTNQNGPSLESFKFKAQDANNDSNEATVTMTVTAVDDLPVAVLDSPTVAEDSEANTIDVLANDTDVDGGPKTISSKTNATNGTVAITNSGADLTYTPNVNYCNNPPTIPVDSFTYTLNGGSVGTVNVTVTCADDLPVAVNDTKTMNEDAGATAIDVLANDTDVDGGPKAISSKTDGTNGTVAITNSGADLTYTPNANYCNNPPGTTLDTFTYTLNGGSVATVTVTVTCVDDAPVAVNDTKTVLEDASATTIDVLANDTDIDGGPKFVDAKTNSTNGGTVAITNSGADLTYQPAANYCNDPELQPAGGNLVETFTYTLNGTPASVGTVTVTVTCVNDPPVADTESFNGTDSALSNVRLDNDTSTPGLDIEPANFHNVLTGDTDIEGDTITLIAGADCTGTAPFTCLTDGYDPDGIGAQPVERGTVSLEADGDFHYVPPPGFVGTDSFDYRISDGGLANSEANGTVNINVAGPTVWFVDDPAAAGGNGTSTSPLNSLTPLSTGGTSNHIDDANDRIFVYEGTYTNGIVLENGQKLLGHPHSLDVTDTVGRTHTDLVSGAGTPPAISHAANTVVTLGSGNELQDLALGNGTITLGGASVGTATVRDTSINTTGKALDVNGGTLDMVFTNVSSSGSPTQAINLVSVAGAFTAPAGSLQNATNTDVSLNDVEGDFTYGGSISDSSGVVVSIVNGNSGTKDFNGTITGGSAGSGPRIELGGNPGSIIRFDNDLTLNTGSQPAFNATGGGTIHVTSDDNSLTTTTGTPLNVVNTTIGSGDLIFDSISSSGAANGIVLDNTGNTGNLHVTGNPGADTNEGGTITGTTGVDAATNQCAKPPGQPVGVAILLKDTKGVILNDMLINGSSNYGLLGHDVNGFTLDDSTFNGTHGTNEGQDEGTVMFCGLTGSASVTDSSVLGGYENSFMVSNSSGTLNPLTVSNSDFATSTGALSDDAFNASAFNNATMNVTVNNDSDFTTARGDLLNYRLNNNAVGTLTLDNNDFSNNHPSIVSGGGGITIAAGGGGSNTDLNYSISNNDFRDALGNGVTITTGVGNGAGDYDGSFTNNRIGVAGVTDSGSEQASGLTFNHEGSGTHTASVTGNTIQEYSNRAGIRINPQGTTGSPMRMTIKGNTVTQPGTFGDTGIEVDIASTSNTLCLDIGGAGADANNVHGSDVGGGGAFFDINILTNSASNTINLPGYAGGAKDQTAIESFLIARNSAGGTPNAFADTTGSFGNGGANCS
ncbi:MAG: Ig-like domain-containing protein [Actinomycetota bacterium]|nr:Ig-like domain-containing protein [Actinomycetota bacterium]